MILQVYPAATVVSSLPSASPGTNITFTGSGFVPMEAVKIHVGGFGTTPVATVTADAAGNFTIAASVPQRPYGPEDVYAAGQTSGRLGATTDQLREHLRAHPGYYHVSFDGHGAYGDGVGGHSQHRYRGAHGKLLFETAEGAPDPKSASDLNPLLRDYAVPAVRDCAPRGGPK